jgi:cell fate (sporulation/competence/biofilm development) regulator YmcA (YheA/YmcA/DUF963 family)
MFDAVSSGAYGEPRQVGYRAAEDRIAELEAEVQHYREKSERAEDWLRQISTEIEDRLINQPEEKRRQMSRRI